VLSPDDPCYRRRNGTCLPLSYRNSNSFFSPKPRWVVPCGNNSSTAAGLPLGLAVEENNYCNNSINGPSEQHHPTNARLWSRYATIGTDAVDDDAGRNAWCGWIKRKTTRNNHAIRPIAQTGHHHRASVVILARDEASYPSPYFAVRSGR
jgi:hypothetical protein